MNGQLILTAYTYDQGLDAINTAFSGTGNLNHLILDGNFSGGTSGGVIYSGGTDLYDIFATTASNGLTLGGYNVTLGGDLTGSTTIINPGFVFELSGSVGGPANYNRIYQKGAVGSSYYELKTHALAGAIMVGSDGINITNTISATNGAIQLDYNSGGTDVQINVDSNGVEIIDNFGNKGAYYAANYHSAFNSRSIPDVEWADIHILSASTQFWSSSTGTLSIIANNGTGNAAGGDGAMAIGNQTTATGDLSLAIGNQTTATGDLSLAGGGLSTAGGIRSFAFGQSVIASATNSVAFGSGSTAQGTNSYAIGQNGVALGLNAFAGGLNSQSTGEESFAFGASVSGNNTAAFAIGQVTRAAGASSFASGTYTEALGNNSFVGGIGNSYATPVHAKSVASFNFSVVNSLYTGEGVGTNSTGAAILGGLDQEIKQNSGINSDYSSILGGEFGIIEGASVAGLFAGSYNRITGAFVGSPYAAIIGGQANQIYDLPGAVILGSSGLTATSETYKVYMQKAYVDGYIDFNPQTTMPAPQEGREFYSGAPLHRKILFTGNSAGEYMVLQ